MYILVIGIIFSAVAASVLFYFCCDECRVREARNSLALKIPMMESKGVNVTIEDLEAFANPPPPLKSEIKTLEKPDKPIVHINIESETKQIKEQISEDDCSIFKGLADKDKNKKVSASISEVDNACSGGGDADPGHSYQSNNKKVMSLVIIHRDPINISATGSGLEDADQFQDASDDSQKLSSFKRKRRGSEVSDRNGFGLEDQVDSVPGQLDREREEDVFLDCEDAAQGQRPGDEKKGPARGSQ